MELELVNVANVKISRSNVASFQFGIGDLRIVCGTLLFVSRFSTLSSQNNPKTQLRALGELGVSQLGIGIGIGNISTLATFTRGAKGSAY